MKIKVSKGLYVDSSTLIRFEWRKYYPALIIHEKFEKILKWILRSIAFVGIATSVVTINLWYVSLGLAIIIFLIEQFFERTAIEYTTMIVQPFPDFEIDYSQWKTNGFMLPIDPNSKELAYFGPSYSDEPYAIKFFTYVRSWVDNDSNDDTQNDLIISLIIEPDEEYTTYLYANPDRKRLDSMFNTIKEQSKLEKFGKRQQQFVSQMYYWKTMDFKDGYNIKKFLEFQKNGKPFILSPSVLQPFGLPPKFLHEHAIKKYHLKVKKRSELSRSDTEYQFPPEKLKEKDQEKRKPYVPDVFSEIQDVLSKSEDVGFMSNEGSKAGVINLCFKDPTLAFEGYKILLEKSVDEEVILTFHEHDKFLDILIEVPGLQKRILLNNLNFNKPEFNSFRKNMGGGPKVVLVVGYPPASGRQIILSKGMSPLVVTWKFAS